MDIVNVFDEHAKVVRKMTENKKVQDLILEKLAIEDNPQLEMQINNLKKEYEDLIRLNREYDSRYKTR
ncbi:MAG: hypothetical protein ACQEW5_26095 [Bacillota bacterium]